jgi:Flp pilus assembly pilin Flp
MMPRIRRLWVEENGQDIAEYAVMLAVILVLVVGTIRSSAPTRITSSPRSQVQFIRVPVPRAAGRPKLQAQGPKRTATTPRGADPWTSADLRRQGESSFLPLSILPRPRVDLPACPA